MPPRGRPGSKGPAVQETPLETATIRLRPGYDPGLCLQSPLFFASETWANTIRPDVDALLTAFEQNWRAERASGGRSPFELFRELWEEQGWGKLHLTGMMEGPIRKPWAEAVVRGFVEHLNASTAPLRQVAALFSLYALWSTQPPKMEQVFISVDPTTLQYLLTLPDVLAPSLDDPPSPTATDTLPATSNVDQANEDVAATAALPSLDLSVILTSLISENAFFLVPTPTFLFPPLPSNSIREARRKGMDKTAMGLLGAEEEMEALVDGRFGDVPAMGDRSGSPDGRSRSQTVGGEGDGDWDDEKGWMADLGSLQGDYLKTKSSAFPTTSAASSTSNPRPTATNVLESRVLNSAGNLTLGALRTAGSGFGAVMEVDLGDEDLEQGEGAEGMRKRRKVELMGLVGAEGGEPKGLKAFEETVEQLGETVVEVEDCEDEQELTTV